MPGSDVCTRNIKTRQRLEANEKKVLRKIVGKTKICRIRSQQIRVSCCIQLINFWVETRREWDEHVARMGSERLVKISRENILVERISPGRPKRRLNPWLKQAESPTAKKKTHRY